MIDAMADVAFVLVGMAMIIVGLAIPIYVLIVLIVWNNC